MRTSATDVFGDVIPDQVAAAEYSKTYTVAIPAGWNSNKLSIAAMVVKANKDLLNAQQATVGSTKDFEILIP